MPIAKVDDTYKIILLIVKKFNLSEGEYKKSISNALKAFDSAREWADLIKCLQYLVKVIINNYFFFTSG